MLNRYYNVIRNSFDLLTVDIAINRQHSALDVFIFRSLKYRICFEGNHYTVKIICDNGICIDTVGGVQISERVTDECLIKTINYLVEYSRLRIGQKYINMVNEIEYR